MPHEHEQNRRSWNAVTPAHQSHKRDQAEFFRGGGSTLFDDEVQLLGDVRGLRVAHLQCNCGQDSLSVAALGAHVTGVDISDAAIDEAVALASAIDRDDSTTFVRADVVDWMHDTDERFDRALSTYGTIGWLSDLGAWARGVHRILKPGGYLAFLEFHPLVWSFRALSKDAVTWGDSYFQRGAIHEADGVNDYVARSGEALTPMGRVEGIADFENPQPAVGFQYTCADIVSALTAAGLQIDAMKEYPYSNGCKLFDGMVEQPGRRYGLPEGVASLPLMLGIRARRTLGTGS